MKRFYCNGKKGCCEKYDEEQQIPSCTFCDFQDGTGGEVREVSETHYDRIRNMRIDEMADFICSIFDSFDKPYSGDKNIEGYTIFNYDEHKIREWLESEVV